MLLIALKCVRCMIIKTEEFGLPWRERWEEVKEAIGGINGDGQT